MAYKLIIKEEACADIDAAFRYYEAQQKGLGILFMEYVEQSLIEVELHPHHYSFYLNQQSFRSHSLAKFPFTIVFEIIEEEVIVYAVFNTYQNPISLTKIFSR